MRRRAAAFVNRPSAFVLLLLATLASVSLAQAQTAKPRNIVFILADDHRYDALGVMGHPLARTPNMDALAKGGAHMRNAFVTTALCSPSRASIWSDVGSSSTMISTLSNRSVI